jgi:hypothetical protein
MPDLKEKALALISTTTSIDATSVAITALYTVPAGKTFIPRGVVIRVTAFTAGGKATQATASFGGNSATYDDFINTREHTISAVSKFVTHFPDAGTDGGMTELDVQAAADSFRCSIEVASDATTEDWAVDLFGYLV